MAKVLAPLHSIQVRGKWGGVVFRRWRNVNTASGPCGGIGNSSEAHVVAWRAAVASWGGLTQEKIEEWKEFAKAHEMERGPWKPKQRSGFISYSLAAYLAGQCGESYPTAPPGIPAPNYPATFYLNLYGGKIYAVWNPGDEGDYVEVKWVVNQDPAWRIYDYKLLLKGYYPIAQEEVIGPDWIAGRNHRASLRLIRSDGQAGQKGFTSLET